MDLRVYYQKVRDAMATVPGEFGVVKSCETPDGGKAGVFSEVTKLIAARMIVDGRAVLATAEETSAHLVKESELHAKAVQAAAPPRVQVAILSQADLDALQSPRPGKTPEKK